MYVHIEDKPQLKSKSRGLESCRGHFANICIQWREILVKIHN
jgi:hypothetical protein